MKPKLELHRPMRTCVGCHELVPQDELVRLKLAGGKVAIVRPGKEIPGRSIYLCPQQTCWQNALRRGALTFKASKHDRVVVRLDTNERDQLIMRLKRYVREERQRN